MAEQNKTAAPKVEPAKGDPAEQQRAKADAERVAKLPHTAATGGDLKQQESTVGGSGSSDEEKAKLAEVNPDAGEAEEATESGALMETGVKEVVDLEHPAVDNKPRMGLPEHSNRIDFNDPRY